MLEGKILVTGGSGMVGKALQRECKAQGLKAIFPKSTDYDLTVKNDVEFMFRDHRPDYIIHLAAKVGGVKGNMKYPMDFFYDNILMNTHVLDYACINDVKKVLSMLSTCIYPDEVEYPLREEYIHDGPPHDSNFAYAYAKRMLDVHSRAARRQEGANYICAVPNNLFGEFDNYHLEDSHVIPAITRKIWEAKQNNEDVTLWGSGNPVREFTYSRDIAKALLWMLEHYDDEKPLNIGNTEEHSIKEVAEVIAEVLNFQGKIIWDTTQPEGQFRKPSDNSRFRVKCPEFKYTDFHHAMVVTTSWFIANYPNIRGVK